MKTPSYLERESVVAGFNLKPTALASCETASARARNAILGTGAEKGEHFALKSVQDSFGVLRSAFRTPHLGVRVNQLALHRKVIAAFSTFEFDVWHNIISYLILIIIIILLWR